MRKIIIQILILLSVSQVNGQAVEVRSLISNGGKVTVNDSFTSIISIGEVCVSGIEFPTYSGNIGYLEPFPHWDLRINNPFSNQLIKVYPNPSNGNFYIDPSEKPIVSIKLYDNTGRLCFEDFKILNGIYEINEQLNPGIYTILIQSETGLYSQKITIL